LRRAWQVASVTFLGFALLILFNSLQYPYFDPLGPGPGFFPVWLSVLAGALALALFLQVSLTRTIDLPASGGSPGPTGAASAGRVLAGLVGLVAMLDAVGFRIAVFLFMVYLPLALGVRNLWTTLVIALAGSFGIFHIFYYWLKLPLPVGPLGL
jgi:putative tricarboxylic transport membrane protein